MNAAEVDTAEQLPLAGIRVIEFCQVAAGPFCGMLLADMGAEVIKVERPEGDGLRQWPPLTDGFSENFASLNRNKKSVVLDLKTPDGQAHAKQLCLSADVVIENNRPGVMQRLGLGYAVLAELSPSLVYCSLSAFGQTGPRAEEGGFDLTVQGMAGVMSVTGEPGGVPVKCGVPISDFSTGLYGAFAVAAVLNRVRAGGPGEHIDISLQGASLGIAALQTSEYFGTGQSPAKLGSAHPRNAPYQAFSAADGHFVMAAGNDGLWHKVCAVVARPDLATDQRFASTALRAANQGVLKDCLEAHFRTAPVADWVRRFAEVGVPCGPINDYEAALNDPQVLASGFIQDITLPSGARTKTFASPIRLGDKATKVRSDPPALGADTEMVLAELAERAPS